MQCKEIMQVIEATYPRTAALDFDNVGLLAGRADKEVNRVYLALDATDRVIERAIEAGADMLITHHPLLFSAVKKVTDEDFITRRIVKLIQNDISYYAMHTNYDVCRMGALVAEKIGLKECVPLEETGEWQELPCGIGVFGILEESEELFSFGERIKEIFGLEELRCFGNSRKIRRVAVCPGSGSSVIDQAIAKGADVFLSGDVGHHTGIDAVAQGMAVLDAGHYGLEYLFMEDMKQYLQKQTGGKIEIFTMPKQLPYSVIL